MRTIPQVRADLLNLDRDLLSLSVAEIGKRIRDAVEDMHRRPPIRRARSVVICDEAKRDQIRAHASAYPDDSYLDMSILFDVPTGRISEVLTGRRQDAKS